MTVGFGLLWDLLISLHRFSRQNWNGFLPIVSSVSDSFCHALSSPSPAQYLCLKTAIHSSCHRLFAPNFADCSPFCHNVFQMYWLNVLPGVPRLLSNWQDVTHRDLLLSGYFIPDYLSSCLQVACSTWQVWNHLNECGTRNKPFPETSIPCKCPVDTATHIYATEQSDTFLTDTSLSVTLILMVRTQVLTLHTGTSF